MIREDRLELMVESYALKSTKVKNHHLRLPNPGSTTAEIHNEVYSAGKTLVFNCVVEIFLYFMY